MDEKSRSSSRPALLMENKPAEHALEWGGACCSEWDPHRRDWKRSATLSTLFSGWPTAEDSKGKTDSIFSEALSLYSGTAHLGRFRRAAAATVRPRKNGSGLVASTAAFGFVQSSSLLRLGCELWAGNRKKDSTDFPCPASGALAEARQRCRRRISASHKQFRYWSRS